MKESLRGYVRIDEASTERVRFAVPLPEYVDRERIGVNIRKIEKLCRIGGIGHLRVTADYESDTSNFVPTIVGVSQKGEAVAAKTGVKRISPTQTSDFNTDKASSPALTWTDGSNIPEIVKRINDDKKYKEGARSIDAWSQKLDLSLRDGIAGIGIPYLTSELFSRNKGLTIYNLINSAINSTSAFTFRPQIPDPNIFIVSLIAGSQVLLGLDYFSYRLGAKPIWKE